MKIDLFRCHKYDFCLLYTLTASLPIILESSNGNLDESSAFIKVTPFFNLNIVYTGKSTEDERIYKAKFAFYIKFI